MTATGGDYAHADVILVGVSRSGKTPTCLYMALQYGVFAANYPLTEEDLEAGTLPARLEPHRRKLYALTIKPERLQQIRNERRPESRYASRQQVQYELRAAEALFSALRDSVLDTTECSIEEIASRILNNTGHRAATASVTLAVAHRHDSCRCDCVHEFRLV